MAVEIFEEDLFSFPCPKIRESASSSVIYARRGPRLVVHNLDVPRVDWAPVEQVNPVTTSVEDAEGQAVRALYFPLFPLPIG